MLCEYGCRQEASFLMTSGKWCCSDFYTKCPNNRKKNSDKNRGRLKTDEHRKKLSDTRIGKTYEELMGFEKAQEQKELRRRQGRPKTGKNNPMYGKTHNANSIILMKEKNSGEKHYGWKGGRSGYFHKKANKLFGLNYCELCNISFDKYSKTHKGKFDMHCTSNPKNYTIMEKSNWECLCRKCHKRRENDKNS